MILTLFFTRLIIDKEGILIQAPLSRLIHYRYFPLHHNFNEIKIDTKWNGRLLIILKGNQLDWLRRITWQTIMGGSWLMPFKWHESLELIENFKNK